MNKFILASTLIIVSMSVTSRAAENTWEKFISSNNEVVYTIWINKIHCSVIERLDGDLNVHASDPSWYGKMVFNYARINSRNGVVENFSYTTSENSMNQWIDTKGGYWVFFEKCREFATKLPPEVRAKFHGASGISN